MKLPGQKAAEWFLRIALSLGFLSAVADRFGLWSKEVSVWGNWNNFIAYTQAINPWMPHSLINFIGWFVTILEIVLAVGLLTNIKTPLVAKITGLLLLIFGLAMTFFLNIKAPLDYSVFVGSAAAFLLSYIAKNKSYQH